MNLSELITPETFKLIVLIWIGIAIVLFPILLNITVPYGRHSKTTWGATISNRLGWFIMESPSLLLLIYFVLRQGDVTKLLVLSASFLWVAHYFHRSIIFPLRINTKGKKMPVLIMLFAILFNLINASINGYWLANFAPELSLTGWNLLRYILGITIFTVGYIINKYHDRLLIKLRKSSTNGYQIPHGGWFKWVSCPNFLGEIIEWTGFALLCWSLPSIAFLIWTMVNLIPRAQDHHSWYKANFIEYPKNRKAIIPLIL